MRKPLYRYQVSGDKGLEERIMDALIKEEPDLKDGYYSVSKLRYAVEKNEQLCHDISVPHNKAGVFFSIALYDKGYIIFGDDEHPGIRPIKWYEPLFLVRLMGKFRKIYWWPPKPYYKL